MVSKIIIVCFDISNEEEEEEMESSSENKKYELDSPLRILDDFLAKETFFEKSEKITTSSDITYTFEVNVPEKIVFEIIILQDLSFIHEISLDADGYLLFINLEKKNTFEYLEKISEYILENCPLDVKTYIIGIHNDSVIPPISEEVMKQFLEEENLNFEYFQINCNNKNSMSLDTNDTDDKENSNILSNQGSLKIKANLSD